MQKCKKLCKKCHVSFGFFLIIALYFVHYVNLHLKPCWHIQCTAYISCWYVHPRFETLDGNMVLQLDPAIPGVFSGPYPLGIDPVKAFTLFTAEKLCSSYSEIYVFANKRKSSWQDKKLKFRIPPLGPSCHSTCHALFCNTSLALLNMPSMMCCWYFDHLQAPDTKLSFVIIIVSGKKKKISAFLC